MTPEERASQQREETKRIIAEMVAKAEDAPESDRILHRKKAMLFALEQQMGNVSAACRMIGIDRSTHYEYLKDPKYAQAVDDVQEMILDFAEQALQTHMMQERNLTAVIFYLKTKGKKRGYIEEHRHAGAQGEKLFDWVALATEAENDQQNLTDNSIDAEWEDATKEEAVIKSLTGARTEDELFFSQFENKEE
jgi:hypothetical protein